MGFPGLPILGVVVVDLLQDREHHVANVVAREVEVGSGGLVQPPVPHISEVLCPPVFRCVLRLPDVLFPAFTALHDVHDIFVLTGVVSGQLHSCGRGGGLDHLGLSDVGTGAARGATFPHAPEHPQDCPLRSGRGWRRQLGSDQFVSYDSYSVSK